uniref:Uncharacterized protein n=1 Tax=Dicentrarchus labrax TaxID=13489 RepID=A0A8C4F5P2_DICLA
SVYFRVFSLLRLPFTAAGPTAGTSSLLFSPAVSEVEGRPISFVLVFFFLSSDLPPELWRKHTGDAEEGSNVGGREEGGNGTGLWRRFKQSLPSLVMVNVWSPRNKMNY